MSRVIDYAADLGRLAELASQPGSVAEVLRGALLSLRDVVDYDLAAVYELQGERLIVRTAEGPLASDRVLAHQLKLAKHPTIKRALELRRPIPLEEHHHAGPEGDPYDGVLDLPPGHSCMVVPLFAGDRTLGIITLDRTQCGRYSESTVHLAAAYGQIVSVAMHLAEQTRLLARYRQQLKEENRLLKEESGDASWAILQLEASRSDAMRELTRLSRSVATSELPVLITGETGAGKEVVAQAIHAWSGRAEQPFVKLNCAAIPETLVESELFGHVRGAFSGAAKERAGRFVTANGGTLLLDEVGDMPAPAQAKLLRVLQEGTFEPLGSDRTVRVDVRVIAATHVDLQAAVERGDFREDLYYRLAAFPLAVPALRERLEDLSAIAGEVLRAIAGRTGRGPWTLDPSADRALRAHDWPGNIRELANALERATILVAQGPLLAQHVRPASSPRRKAAQAPLRFDDMQRQYFRDLLRRTAGRVHGEGGAADLAGLKPTTLTSRLKKLGLKT